MGSTSKQRQTMAKRAREQAVKERRALKLEKKQAAAEERRANASVPTPPADAVEDVVSAEPGVRDGAS